MDDDLRDFLDRSKMRLDEIKRKVPQSHTSMGSSRPRPTGTSFLHDFDMKSPHETDSATAFMPLHRPTGTTPYRASTVMPTNVSPGCTPSKPLLKAANYDGTTPLADYLAQFDIISELNNWTPEVKAMYLAGNLRGAAQSVLSDLDHESRHCYPAIIDALERRFCAENKTELNRTLFKNRVRNKQEKLPELAQNLRRLAKYAYPDAPYRVQDSLAKDQFLDAFNDSDLKWKVYQSRPKTLDDALEIAVECEAFKIAENQRAGFNRVRAVELENEASVGAVETVAPNKTEELLTTLVDMMQKMAKTQNEMMTIKQWQPQQRYHNGQRPRHSHQARTNNGIMRCFKCDQPGHKMARCPTLITTQQPATNAAPANVTQNSRPNDNGNSGNQ